MTLIELLAPFEVSEDDFVDALSRDLRSAPDSSASRLTEAEESLLEEHGGITALVGDDASVRQATLQSASSNLAEQTRESLSVAQVAKLLMVDGSRVPSRARPGAVRVQNRRRPSAADLAVPSSRFDPRPSSDARRAAG